MNFDVFLFYATFHHLPTQFLFPLGIDSLFKKINCDQSSIVEMLGGQTGVKDTNMMQVCSASFVNATPVSLIQPRYVYI